MIKELREVIWPYLEGDPPRYDSFLDENTHIDEKNIDNSVEFARIMYENQNARIATIESKSSIFIGFFGTVVALFSFALKDVLLIEEKELIHNIILLFGSLIIIYTLQVMRFSIKALERKGYHSLDENDFLHGDKKATTISLINKVKNNYDTINTKVDYMTMAHEFTKRIIGVLFLSAISLICISIYNYIPVISDFSKEVFGNKINLRWSDWAIFLLFIVVFYILLQLSRIKKQ